MGVGDSRPQFLGEGFGSVEAAVERLSADGPTVDDSRLLALQAHHVLLHLLHLVCVFSGQLYCDGKRKKES